MGTGPLRPPPAGHGDKISRKAEQAIAALLVQPTIGAAAKQVGVNEWTVRKWLRQEAFLAQYRAARAQVVEVAIAKLQSVAIDAVDTLARNLGCGTPAVEVSAARAVLEQSLRAVELLDIAARVDALESMQQGETS